MKKNYVKLLGTVIMTAALVTNVGLTASAAPKTTQDVTTGRTEQNVTTGTITCNSVKVPHYANSVSLSGTVVIDGPKLVLKVDGVDVTANANIIKVADKIWTYSYTAALNGKVGDVNFNVDAYTIYANGKPSTDIHTKANQAIQIVHVPYVKSFDYKNLSWDNYDRESNKFTFSYNLVKIWDNDESEVVNEKATGIVDGTESYSIKASDITHENGNESLVGTVTPPKTFRNFTFNSGSPEFIYNSESKTYSARLGVTEIWSNNDTATQTITYDGLTPGAETTIPVTIEGVTNSIKITVPAAPVTPIFTVASTSVAVTSVEELANNESKNNFKVTYNLTITLSNGHEYSGIYQETIPYNSGNNSGSKTVTKTIKIDGVDYTVTYNVTAVQSSN